VLRGTSIRQGHLQALLVVYLVKKFLPVVKLGSLSLCSLNPHRGLFQSHVNPVRIRMLRLCKICFSIIFCLLNN